MKDKLNEVVRFKDLLLIFLIFILLDIIIDQLYPVIKKIIF